MAYRSNAENVKAFVANNYAELENPGSFSVEYYAGEKQDFERYYGSPARRRLFINAYEMGQAYGGPEEGGWWVTTYDPVASIPVYSLEEANAAIDQLDAMLEKDYADERPYYSAAGGADGAIMAEDRFARFQPDDPEAYRYS